MFPKQQKVDGSYPIVSASRDAAAEGRRLARVVTRNVIFFGMLFVTAAADLWYPDLGSPYFYGVVAVASLIPLLATVF